jgi:hypothetical protein
VKIGLLWRSISLGEREREIERDRVRERERECVCVCPSCRLYSLLGYHGDFNQNSVSGLLVGICQNHEIPSILPPSANLI